MVMVFIKLLYFSLKKGRGHHAMVKIILLYLQLQLPMQSVPISTKVVSLNPAYGGYTRYNIM